MQLSTAVQNISQSPRWETLRGRKSGKVVYAARALYNGLTHTAHLFNNDCSGGLGSRSISKLTTNSLPLTTIAVYPNPVTNGNFTVVLPNSTTTEALNWQISITDIYGKVVMQKKLVATQSPISLNATKGIYLATLYNKGSGKQLTSKIIVQ